MFILKLWQGFLGKSFRDLVTSNGLHVLQISQPMITSFGRYLKDRVYRSDPKPLEQLKENIQTRISLIPLTMLSQVVGNLSIKINECVARKGGHLQDISFKK